MSDEVFSTTLAYTKSPKVTKRTTFQVKYFYFEWFYMLNTVLGILDLKVLLFNTTVLCKAGVNLCFFWNFADDCIWAPVLSTLLCGFKTTKLNSILGSYNIKS